MTNVLQFKNEDPATKYADELIAETENAIEKILDILQKGETETGKREILGFTLKTFNVVCALINILAQTSSFSEFDKEDKNHFAMQIDRQLNNIKSELKKAIKHNNKNI